MELIGYIGALLIGISLGLIGGGGSILTVPVLVYLFGYHPALATSYSLFVVGSTSSVGAFSHSRMGDVDWKAVLWFGLPSVFTVFITRHWIVPVIPEQLFNINGVVVTKSLMLLVLFAVLMLVAAFKMIGDKKKEKVVMDIQLATGWELVPKGLLLGVVTGMLGAGGGFLIIPALVLLMGLDMRKAIGSSLVIVTVNSLIGFIGSLHHEPIDWRFLLEFTAVAIVGIISGTVFSGKISNQKLKPAFGWFVLAMGLFILIKEAISL